MSYHSLGIVLLSRGDLSLLPGVYKLYDAQAARPSLFLYFLNMEEENFPPASGSKTAIFRREYDAELKRMGEVICPQPYAYSPECSPKTTCLNCLKRKREDQEAAEAHALRMSLFSQERYWINDSGSEEENPDEFPMTREDAVASLCASSYWEDNKQDLS